MNTTKEERDINQEVKDYDIVNNRAIELDKNVLINILSLLINCDPKQPPILPEFRLQQLLLTVTKRIKIITEVKIIESVSSLYCLCLYYSLTTKLISEVTIEFVMLIQLLISECLVHITSLSNSYGNSTTSNNNNYNYDSYISSSNTNNTKNNNNSTYEMLNPLELFVKNKDIDVDYPLELFTKGLELVRNICREILTKLINSLTNKSKSTNSSSNSNSNNKKQTQDIKKLKYKDTNSLQPYSILSICCYSLSHILLLLDNQHLLSIIPGLSETVMSIIITSYLSNEQETKLLLIEKEKEKNTLLHKEIITEKELYQNEKLYENENVITDEDRERLMFRSVGFLSSMKLSYQIMFFIAHKIFNEGNLQQIRLAKSRLDKHLVHPDAIFAQFRTSDYKLLFNSKTNHYYNSIHYNKSSGGRNNDNSGGNSRGNSGQNSSNNEKHSTSILSPISPSRHAANMNSSASILNKSGKVNFANRQYHYYKLDDILPEYMVKNPNVSEDSEDNDSVLVSVASNVSRSTTANTNFNSGFNSPNSPYRSMKSLNKGSRFSPSLKSHGDDFSRSGFSVNSNMFHSNAIDNRYSNQDIVELDSDQIRQYWNLHKTFRPAYVLLQYQVKLRSFIHEVESSKTTKKPAGATSNTISVPATVNHATDTENNYLSKFYSSDYVPSKSTKSYKYLTDYPGFDTITITEAIKFIESQYYYLSSKYYFSRVLDPTSDIYHINLLLLNYLYEITAKGKGFCPTLEHEMRGLKEEMQLLKKSKTLSHIANSRSDAHSKSFSEDKESKSHANKNNLDPIAVDKNGNSTNSSTSNKYSNSNNAASVSIKNTEVGVAKTEDIYYNKVLAVTFDTNQLIESLTKKGKDMTSTKPLAQTGQIAPVNASLLVKTNATTDKSQSKGKKMGKSLPKPVNEKGQPIFSTHNISIDNDSNGSAVVLTSTNKKKSKKALNLQEMLSLASKEAKIEARLHEMEALKKQKKLGVKAKTDNNLTDHKDLADFTEARPIANSTGKKTVQFDSLIDQLDYLIEKKQEKKNNNSSHCITNSSKKELFSVVWHSKKKVVKNTIQNFASEEDDNILNNLPTKKQALEYTKRIKQQKLERENEEKKKLQLLQDQQQIELSKNRAGKVARLRNIRELMMEDIQAKENLKAELLEETKLKFLLEQEKKQKELLERKENEMKEIIRIREIKTWQNEERMRKEREHAELIELEKIRIKKLVDRKEVEEIIRRNQEEERMKYLEGRRKVVEDRLEAERLKKLQEKQLIINEVDELKNKIASRVRNGNFLYHNGKFDFYENVRQKPVEYIEYVEQSTGRLYYYDPLYKTYTYKRPLDSDIIKNSDLEREQYDSEYGEGAYDSYIADIKFKDDFNRDGGYYDENGEWIQATGYYDENYDWVAYPGYYDESGNYIKFAKVEGDLSFMV